MIRFIFIACVVLSPGCANTRYLPSDQFLSLYLGKAFVAWNEDTVNSYQILLKEGGEFSYTITKKEDVEKKEEFYKGAMKLSGDTLFLSYYKDIRPTELVNYLLLEASGRYLIQPFRNKPGRMFLRIQRFKEVI